MGKIDILLRGGLGNQLFIYAALKTLQKKTKMDYNIYDFNTLRFHKFNQYLDLNLFDTKNIIIKKKFSSKLFEKIYIYMKFFFLKNIINEKSNLAFYDKKKKFTLFGYFQKKKWYLNSYKEVISELIENYLFKYSKKVKSYSLVISTNAYPQIFKLGIVLDNNYFLNGLKKLKIKKRTHIIILGNTKNNYIKKLVFFLNQKGYKNVKSYNSLKINLFNLQNKFYKSIFDFLVIAKSQKIIMSNSTFCWWATLTREYFKQDSSRTVIGPKKYTNNMKNNYDNPGNPNLKWQYINNLFIKNFF